MAERYQSPSLGSRAPVFEINGRKREVLMASSSVVLPEV